MTRWPTAGRLVAGLLATGLALGAVLPMPSGPRQAAAAVEAVPDLAMAPLKDFQIQWVNGRRMLRFTAMM
ncbi:MAG: hypothetical protein KY392_06540, partial [Chloroflexi bacterium]|nr:hypothetical protein [Chloroflexota bacterium]